jgi:hypothetical protein
VSPAIDTNRSENRSPVIGSLSEAATSGSFLKKTVQATAERQRHQGHHHTLDFAWATKPKIIIQLFQLLGYKKGLKNLTQIV